MMLEKTELIKAKTEGVENENLKFLLAESSYQKLASAKKVKSLSYKQLMDVILDPAMFQKYFQEIIESGGLPGIDELIKDTETIIKSEKLPIMVEKAQ